MHEITIKVTDNLFNYLSEIAEAEGKSVEVYARIMLCTGVAYDACATLRKNGGESVCR